MRGIFCGATPSACRNSLSVVVGPAGAGSPDHERGRLLAQARVRCGDHRGVGDLGMAAQQRFDLLCRELLAAAVDDVLGAAGHRDAPLGVDEPEVAAAEPAVGVEAVAGVLRVQVAERALRAAHEELPHRAGHHVGPVGVDDADVDAGQDPPVGAEADLGAVVAHAGRDGRALGHPVGATRLHAQFLAPLHQLERDRAPTAVVPTRERQRGQPGGVDRVDELLDEHRRPARVRDPVAHDVVDGLRRVPPLGQQHRAPRHQRERHRHEQTGDVRHRRGHVPAVAKRVRHRAR